jgi:hypothetical protein
LQAAAPGCGRQISTLVRRLAVAIAGGWSVLPGNGLIEIRSLATVLRERSDEAIHLTAQ